MFTKTTITQFMDLGQGFAIETPQFVLSADLAREQWSIELNTQHMIMSNGKWLIPEALQMQMVKDSYPQLIDYKFWRANDELAVRNFQWINHAYLDQPHIIRYSIELWQPVLGCINVWWQGQLINEQGPVCSLRRCQRWYKN